MGTGGGGPGTSETNCQGPQSRAGPRDAQEDNSLPPVNFSKTNERTGETRVYTHISGPKTPSIMALCAVAAGLRCLAAGPTLMAQGPAGRADGARYSLARGLYRQAIFDYMRCGAWRCVLGECGDCNGRTMGEPPPASALTPHRYNIMNTLEAPAGWGPGRVPPPSSPTTQADPLTLSRDQPAVAPNPVILQTAP